MNNEKSSANYVQDGIKSLQKRSNPVELFVQKRVISFILLCKRSNSIWFQLDYLKKNPPTVSTAHILTFEMLYLWILLPLCERPVLEKVLQSNRKYISISIETFCSILAMEKHGDHPKDDVKLRPIICFLEGAVHNIFQDYDYAQNVEFLCFSFRFFSYLAFVSVMTKL